MAYMHRNTYVRILSYPCPKQERTTSLAELAKAGEATGMLEGRLLSDVKISESIQLQADYRRGGPANAEIATSPVIRIEPGYLQTDKFIYALVRIPGPNHKPTVSTAEKKLTVIPRCRFERLVGDLQRQMQALEAPLAHAQALFKIHAVQFARVRGDIINPTTNTAITAPVLHHDFSALMDGLRYHYAMDERERVQCNHDLWIAGHRVQAAVLGAIETEGAFLLDKGYLELFTRVHALLSRILKGVKFISTLSPEGEDDSAAH